MQFEFFRHSSGDVILKGFIMWTTLSEKNAFEHVKKACADSDHPAHA